MINNQLATTVAVDSEEEAMIRYGSEIALCIGEDKTKEITQP